MEYGLGGVFWLGFWFFGWEEW